ncbi:hypothetical protein [Phycicoccus sp. 3266]|uniref:hypothetical protein n=1 Tax=Phycicoccus sp. 3266 TaxID=2817751 RepID=UPI00285F1E1A|nr:hypothetical protein [Phycicoccus sp. 3266]MDR6861986.1 hypothetical protein [Phycicoccus sp. 3266]
MALFDGAGYAYGGNAVATSGSFAALSAVPGGMRTWGVLLLAGALAVAWGIGRDGHEHPRALNITLAIGVGYYLFFAGMIVAAWVSIGSVPAWGALSKPLAFAVLYYLCARAVAPSGFTWYDRAIYWLAQRARSLRGRG